MPGKKQFQKYIREQAIFFAIGYASLFFTIVGLFTPGSGIPLFFLAWVGSALYNFTQGKLSANKYFRGKRSVSEATNILNDPRNQPLTLTMSLNEKSTGGGKNKKGKKQPVRRGEQGYAEQQFFYTQWADMTNLNFLQGITLARLNISFVVDYSVDARSSLEFQKHHFIEANKKNNNYSFEMKQDRPGEWLREFMLVYNGQEPWYAKKPVLILMDVFMCSWIYTMLFQKESEPMEVKIVRRIII